MKKHLIKAFMFMVVTIILISVYYTVNHPIKWVGGIGFIMIGYYIRCYYDMKEATSHKK